MTEVISTSLDLGKEIKCPDYDPQKPCRKKACRFWEFCKAAEGDAGDE
jgi:hypothetical protein